MFGDLLSSRWFQVGFAFFVLCVGGSLLYSWHVQRTTEVSEFGKRPQPVVSIENTPETNTAPVDIQTEGVVNTPDENTDTQMPDETEAETIDATEFADLADAFLPDDFVSAEEAPAEDVPVSPFGFGPYPEVPEAFMRKVGRPPWLVDRQGKRYELPENTKRGVEIIYRVLIGLWKQGDKSITGGCRNSGTGLVYPYYDNTIYIRLRGPSKAGKANGIEVISAPSVMITAEERQRLKEGGDAPAGIRVLDLDTAGVDPSPFLNVR